MRIHSFLISLLLVLTAGALGCEKAPEEPAAEVPAEVTAEPAQAPAEPPTAEPTAAPQAAAPVTVTEEGSKFDPAVAVAQLPAGAWYCDMGTVHWAAMKAPADGNCPLCGMKLKQLDPDKLADQEGAAVEAKPHDEADHAHDGQDDDHGHAH